MTSDEIYEGLLTLTELGRIDWTVGGSRTCVHFTTEIWDNDVDKIVQVTVQAVGERPVTTRVKIKVGDAPDQLAPSFNVHDFRLPAAIGARLNDSDQQMQIARDTISRIVASARHNQVGAPQ